MELFTSSAMNVGIDYAKISRRSSITVVANIMIKMANGFPMEVFLSNLSMKTSRIIFETLQLNLEISKKNLK